MFLLASLQRTLISVNSSSDSPILSAPIAIKADSPPWYPNASVATFPRCLNSYSGLPFLILSIGTLNIWLAVAS